MLRFWFVKHQVNKNIRLLEYEGTSKKAIIKSVAAEPNEAEKIRKKMEEKNNYKISRKMSSYPSSTGEVLFFF